MRRTAATIGLTLLAIGATTHSALGELLIDRVDAIAIGEPWRLWSGHFVHASTPHLLFNLVLFIPLLALIEHRHGARFAIATCAALALGVAVGIRLLHTGWSTYVGLSGVVYGLVPVALLLAPRVGRVSILVVIAIVAKSGLECLGDGWLVSSESLSSLFEVRYLAGSHLSGLAVGLGVVMGHRVRRVSTVPVIAGTPPDTA